MRITLSESFHEAIKITAIQSVHLDATKQLLEVKLDLYICKTDVLKLLQL